MHKSVLIFALAGVLSGCGGAHSPASTARSSPPATSASKDPLAHFSEGVRRYYAGAQPDAADDPNADAEERYFQPPRPAQAKLGDAITLTGSNIGVQLAVTPTTLTTVTVGGKRFNAVEVELDNDDGGIAVYDGELRMASLTYADGRTRPVVWGVKAPCSNSFENHVRIDVSAKTRGCLLFPVSDQQPSSLQIALEQVPTDAGGIWKL
jgi:hypothetical protein